MPFLRSPELQPIKGIDLSVPETYLGPGYARPQNMTLYRGEIIKRYGRSLLGEVSLGAEKILHLGIQEVSSGTVRLFRHTKKNLQRYNTTTLVWDDLTGADLTGAETDFYSHAVVPEDDLYLFSNRAIDNIRVYDGSGNSADLGGSPPKCRVMDYISPYVMLGFVIDGGNTFPTKVQWNDTGAPTVWSGGNSGSQVLSDEPSHIRQVKKLRDYAMVYKEKSIYRGRRVTTSSIFDFGSGPFQTGKGLYSPRAVADNGEAHFYMGPYDFHVNDGVRIQDIGGPIREYIFNRVNRTLNETCHALHVEEYKEVWFFITIGGNSWPTEVWKYRYDLGFWYFDTVANCISANLYKATSTKTWNDLAGSWNAQADIWDSQAGLSGAAIPVFGFDTGFVHKHDVSTYNDIGVAVDSRVETKDYSGLVQNGIERDTRWLQFDLWARGNSAKLYYSTDYGDTWTYVAENTLSASAVEKSIFYFDIIAKHIRFRVVQDGLSKNLVVRGFTPYFLDVGDILA